MEVVYIDILIIENFLINYLLLYIVNRFCRKNASKWRLMAAAGIGAIYVLVIFFPRLHIFYTFLMKVMMSMIMIIVSFVPKRLKDFIKEIILFYIEAFIIGGCILAIFYLNNFIPAYEKGILMIEVSPVYIIFGSAAAIILVKLGFDCYEGFYMGEKSRVMLQIYLNERRCSLNALIDTGNSLKDPITNTPVIIAYYKSLIDILPEDMNLIMCKDINSDELINVFMESSLKSCIRIIPYKALGVENGILIGIKVDRVIIKSRNKSCVVGNSVIALSIQPISEDGDYQALAYPEIIKECK